MDFSKGKYMFAYKQHITIDDPNHVVLSHLPFQPGQKVEVLFLVDEDRVDIQRLERDALFQGPKTLSQIQTVTEEDVATLVPIEQSQQSGRRVFGAMRGKARMGDAFFEPLPESELSAWES